MLAVATVLAAILPGMAVATPKPEPIAYTLSPKIVAGKLDSLEVTIRLQADRDGRTEIGWESEWAGEKQLSRWMRDFHVSGATDVKPEADGRWLVASRPSTPLTIHYRIVSAYDGDPNSDDLAQPKPAVRPRWFYAVGEALFAVPLEHEDAPASFAWTGAPQGFGFASDLQHLMGPPGATVGDILESISIGGWDLNVSGSIDSASGVRVASIGKYAFDTRQFDDLISRIITTERHFWRAERHSPMLVTAISLHHQPDHTSSSGTGRGDAFAMWIDETVPLDAMEWLLGHEYFHTWNPAALGTLPAGDQEASEYWLSEGFTDYYARALLLRGGIVTPRDFVDQWNQMLLAYARSDVRTMPNAAIGAGFWSRDAVHDLPYQRGAMLAAIWNRRLRATSGGKTGLDDVLRAQRDAAKPDRDLVASLIAQAANDGLKIEDDIRDDVLAGKPIVLPPDIFGPCAVVGEIHVPLFDLGFDFAATQKAGKTITGVDPKSAAYAAGLRDGMKLLDVLSGDKYNSALPVKLRIAADGQVREISYLPQGSAGFTAQQMRLVKDTPDCATSLSGM